MSDLRQRRIDLAREFLAEETDWGTDIGSRSAAYRLGAAEHIIRTLIEELEGG